MESDKRCATFRYDGVQCPCKAKYGNLCGRHSPRCIKCGTHFSSPNEKYQHYCQTMSLKIKAPPACIESNNVLWKLIFKYPRKRWDWRLISRNSCTTLDIIECFIKNQDIFKFSWEDISSNPNLTAEFIKKHPYNRWDWNRISMNSSFVLKDVKNNPEFPWKPNSLVVNGSFSDSDVEYVLEQYSWQKNVWENRNLSLEFIKKHLNGKKPNWKYLARNPNITPEFLEENVIDLSNFNFWIRLSLSATENYNFTLDFYEKHAADHEWGLNLENSIFDAKFIEKHATEILHGIETHYHNYAIRLLKNKNLTLELLDRCGFLRTPNILRNLSTLRVTYTEVESHPEVEWDYYYLGQNCKIPISRLENKWNSSHAVTNYCISQRCDNKEEFIEENLDDFIPVISGRNLNYNPRVQKMIDERQDVMDTFGYIRDVFNIIKEYEGIRLKDWTCYYCD